MDDLLTTRQLQDLLRVDRITIYRMLNDGRLRGFKVGGQWRFSRREVETWLLEMQTRPGRTPTSSWPDGSTTPPSQVLPLPCIQAIQAICAEALDVAVVTTGLDGTPLASISNSCAFCALILSSEPGRLRCAGSWRQQPDGQAQPCHAGLLCASLPVSVQEQPVALVAACQFTTQGSQGAAADWQARLPELSASLGLLQRDLWAAAGSVRVLEEKDLARVSRLLGLVVDTFAKISQERSYLLGRLEKIAEMSRI